MLIRKLDDQVSVSEQITAFDVPQLMDQGIEVLVCNRPDGEEGGQPLLDEIRGAAERYDMTCVHLPFSGARPSNAEVEEFAALLHSGKKLHAYCRTGTRSTNLWALACEAMGCERDSIIKQAVIAGYDVAPLLDAAELATESAAFSGKKTFEIVIVGAGSGGIAVAASLLKRRPRSHIAIVDPSREHYYQPGWTMVGGGVFDARSTQRYTEHLIPRGVELVRQSVVSFSPRESTVLLSDQQEIAYEQLVVCPGLTLDWSAIEGLEDTLGQHGVTSNYRYDLAPYTWQLVQELKKGKAVFTQPPMPIKCAGAPQKAMYLSADYWFKKNRINEVSIDFYNSGAVLFGVEAYVPALMDYVRKYQAQLHFEHTLSKVDGPNKRLTFNATDDTGAAISVETDFDMVHVCPPQRAPDFIRESALSDAGGWLDVDQNSLRHNRFHNIWGVGDVLNTPNAKTMAAVRQQAPVVAQNICDALNSKHPSAGYYGYGSCPLTVERGKIVLAEFGYGGKLMPTFPNWINDGTKPTRLAWLLKARMLPAIYWHAMLQGREWFAQPEALVEQS